jgi:hypothetical protein
MRAPDSVISCKAAHGLSDDLLNVPKGDLERSATASKN